MSELKEYLPKQIQPERKIGKIIKRGFGNWEVLLHALLPHARPEYPSKDFNEQIISSDADYVYSTAFEMYKDSYARIDGIEQKGFNLLTYISAIAAILVYYLSKDITGSYKIVVIIALSILALAIIISLRCLSIKSQKRIFIDGLFKYDPQLAPTQKSKKAIISELLNSAVINQGIADNTADLLKATRILLSLGIVMTLISSVFYLNSNTKDEKKVNFTKVSFADSAIIQRLAGEKQKARLDSQFVALKQQVALLKARQDSLLNISKKSTVSKTKPKKY